MAGLLDKMNATLQGLDEFLARYATMVDAQRRRAAAPSATAADAALLKQMLLAQSVVSDRRRDLHAALRDRAGDRIVHELWSLGGDLPHFEFDVSALPGADVYESLRERLSLDALKLTRELGAPAALAELLAELGARP